MISLPLIPTSHIADAYIVQTLLYTMSIFMMIGCLYYNFKKCSKVELATEKEEEEKEEEDLQKKKYNTHFYIDLHQLL